MPIRAIIQIWQNEGYKVIIFFASTPHDFINAKQALNGFLSDNIFRISQFLYN